MSTTVTINLAPTAVNDTIRHLGRLLWDLEKVRMGNGNRYKAAVRARGDALPELQAANALMPPLENAVEKMLMAAWRTHPLHKWATSVPQCGGSVVARLIAEIGDPALRSIGHWDGEGFGRLWVIDEYMPRTCAQLFAYTGHGRAERIPTNATQEELFRFGNRTARVLLWRLGEQFVKGVGGQVGAIMTRRCPYRDVYETRRLTNVERSTNGEPWTDGHKHADAMRIARKAFLADLWREDARRRGMPTRDS